MVILAIETATSVCSAALLSGAEVIAHRLHPGPANHAQQLPVFVDELLDEAKEKGLVVEAIAVSEGPGSYTGLRIGVSMAKGLAYGLKVPLVAVPTLHILAMAAVGKTDADRICPLLDARRMEVYTAMFDSSARALSTVEAKVVDADSFAEEIREHRVVFVGDGATKCKDVIVSKNAVFIEGILMDARYMGAIAQERLEKGQTADVAYMEPFYLKEFVAAPSHVKGLNG